LFVAEAFTEKDKERFSNIMAFGRDIEQNPFIIEDDSIPEPEVVMDRFDERMNIRIFRFLNKWGSFEIVSFLSK
jgi:hypothetical protein